MTPADSSSYRFYATTIFSYFQQLNDSSVIVSVLSTYLNDTSTKLTDVVKFYPNIAFMDDDGTIKKEVLNRYHVMYHGQQSESASKRIVLVLKCCLVCIRGLAESRTPSRNC